MLFLGAFDVVEESVEIQSTSDMVDYSWMLSEVKTILAAADGATMSLTTGSGFEPVTVMVETPPQTIPITTTETIFNFDLGGLIPPAPYDSIVFSAEFDNGNPINVGVDSMISNVYGELSGIGLVQTRNDTLPGFPFDASFNEAGTLYGPLTTANPLFVVFSLRRS